MKVLKWFGLVLLGIILFFSLTAFGLAFTIKMTALNPHFYEKQIDRLPLNRIIQDMDADIAPELRTALVDSITAIEPQLKEETGQFFDSVFDYMTGKKNNPELAQSLRNTLLSDSFMNLVIENMDLATILESSVREQLSQELPQELSPLLNKLKPILVKNEPQLKSQLRAALPGILDYILGMSNNFSATFNLDFLVDEIKAEAKVILRNDPAFAGASDAQLNAYIDNNLSAQLEDFNTAVTLDQTTLGPDAQLTASIHDAEKAMADAKPFILMFNRYYIWLIILIIILIAGIAAIHHAIKGATRSLGSIFISYGILNFVPLLIFKYAIAPRVIYPELTAELPVYMETYVRQVINDSISPIFWFSLGCLIAGIALLVVSFVYRPSQKTKTETPVTSAPAPQS